MKTKSILFIVSTQILLSCSKDSGTSPNVLPEIIAAIKPEPERFKISVSDPGFQVQIETTDGIFLKVPVQLETEQGTVTDSAEISISSQISLKNRILNLLPNAGPDGMLASGGQLTISGKWKGNNLVCPRGKYFQIGIPAPDSFAQNYPNLSVWRSTWNSTDATPPILIWSEVNTSEPAYNWKIYKVPSESLGLQFAPNTAEYYLLGSNGFFHTQIATYPANQSKNISIKVNIPTIYTDKNTLAFVCVPKLNGLVNSGQLGENKIRTFAKIFPEGYSGYFITLSKIGNQFRYAKQAITFSEGMTIDVNPINCTIEEFKNALNQW